MGFLYNTRLALRGEFFLSGFFPLFPVEQFVAHFAEADQVIQVVKLVPLVFVGSMMGLES
jgi:uncharacterized membrane protein (GlpM family)